MRKLVASFFISLDGVVESPDQWHFPYWSDEMGDIVTAGVEGASGFLMGRRLYDEWSEYWPSSQDEPFASQMNAQRKIVLTSRSIEGELWNNTTVIDQDHVAGVQAAKDAIDGDLAMSGSATTVRWLLANGLLDELALLVHPIAVAKGQRLFEDTGTVPLKLTHSEALPSGVLHVRYVPA